MQLRFLGGTGTVTGSKILVKRRQMGMLGARFSATLQS